MICFKTGRLPICSISFRLGPYFISSFMRFFTDETARNRTRGPGLAFSSITLHSGTLYGAYHTENMAELFDCSVSYLTKMFKSRLNDSPIRLLAKVRAQKAAMILARRGTSLQEIAELVGYPDAHTLSRSFKSIRHNSCSVPGNRFPDRKPNTGNAQTAYPICPCCYRTSML